MAPDGPGGEAGGAGGSSGAASPKSPEQACLGVGDAEGGCVGPHAVGGCASEGADNGTGEVFQHARGKCDMRCIPVAHVSGECMVSMR